MASVGVLWKGGVLCLTALSLTRCTTVAIVGGGAAVGTMALRDKSVGETVSDTALSARVKKALYKVSPDVHALVGVNVQEGEVLLTGALPTEKLRTDAEKAVWKVRDVRCVYNNIAISDRAPICNYSKDAWITSQVKAKLLGTAKIRSVNYSVKTVNNVVYIFGIARTKAELDHVVDIASRVRGVDRVMSYIRLRDEN